MIVTVLQLYLYTSKTNMSIRINNNILQYYGNAAGYISDGFAYVDPIFKTPELLKFLKDHHQNIKIRWKSGVYNTLIKYDNKIQILKKCRIWQLKSNVPIGIKYLSYEKLLKKYGFPDKDNYQLVFDNEVETNNLEELYKNFNQLTFERSVRLLCISDVIELYDETSSDFYYIDCYKFQKFSFE